MELKSAFESSLNYLIATRQPDCLWVALSGGLDSVSLLYLVADARRQGWLQLPIKAVHINHGLSKNAADWENSCQSLCEHLDIELAVRHVIPRQGARLSLEQEARAARYQALQETVSSNELLLTGHHQDDQAETFLLRLQRGSGPTGLAAMASISEVREGLWVGRPLLEVRRQGLEAYLATKSIAWVEDESNFDQGFDRNFLRHQIMPLLRTRWPAIDATISRSAKLCTEQEQLVDELLQDDLMRAMGGVPGQSERPGQLSVIYLRDQSTLKQRALFRGWLKLHRALMPNEAKLTSALPDLLYARADASPELQGEGWVVRRYRDLLWLVEPQPVSDLSNEVICWDMSEPLKLPCSLGWLHADKVKSDSSIGLRLPLSDAEVVTVRFRSPATSIQCKPAGRSGSRSLKKLLHEYGVPPWLRDQVPLLFYGEELAAVVGLFVCEPFVEVAGQGVNVNLEASL
ncbi:tRNA lysidine(34) synthetase TilS [Corallincola platygyrae]|uniref:tRNA(Ile)-lysidine synthase n=1 Tax=Corallincola platygyrae TaxID=1193278 RepID=A0ABW4XR38_9GAMM